MPSSNGSLFEIDAVRRVEAVCRGRLARQPEDTAARIGLAWCLLLRSVHRAGQESVLEQLAAADLQHLEVLASRTPSLSDGDAGQLIRDCLKNTFTVMQLSGNPLDLANAERLQTLARLSGANQAVINAEADSFRAIGRLIRDLMDTPETNGSNGQPAG